MEGGERRGDSDSRLTFPAYHARMEKTMVSTTNMTRTSLKVKPFSLSPAVSLVTPWNKT